MHGVKHGAAVQVLHVSVAIVPIVDELAPDSLFVQLEIIKRLDLPNALEMISVIRGAKVLAKNSAARCPVEMNCSYSRGVGCRRVFDVLGGLCVDALHLGLEDLIKVAGAICVSQRCSQALARVLSL